MQLKQLPSTSCLQQHAHARCMWMNGERCCDIRTEIRNGAKMPIWTEIFFVSKCRFEMKMYQCGCSLILVQAESFLYKRFQCKRYSLGRLNGGVGIFLHEAEKKEIRE